MATLATRAKNPGNTRENDQIPVFRSIDEIPPNPVREWEIGPCAKCHLPTRRYGDHGKPLCPQCQPTTKGKTPNKKTNQPIANKTTTKNKERHLHVEN